jgi:putative membrane protein
MVLWVEALHVISVIAWMAGMLYLPRLFVYHAQAARGSEASETFKVMERRPTGACNDCSPISAFP